MDQFFIEEAAKTADLKPCPFCGGNAEWCIGKNADGSDWHYIACADCECLGPYVSSDTITSRDTTLRLWNTRT